MPKLIIMYNLRDDVTEEDFMQFVNEFKGPFVVGMNAVKSYTITKVQGAMKAEGGPPGPVDPPYGIAAIVDVTSLEDYAKDQATPAYQEDFMPRFMKWVKSVMILRCDELYYGEK